MIDLNLLFVYTGNKQDMLRRAKVVKQLDDKYVVCHVPPVTDGDGDGPDSGGNDGRAASVVRPMVVLVDQHAAHERVRLEGFLATLAEQKTVCVCGICFACALGQSPHLDLAMRAEIGPSSTRWSLHEVHWLE